MRLSSSAVFTVNITNPAVQDHKKIFSVGYRKLVVKEIDSPTMLIYISLIYIILD